MDELFLGGFNDFQLMRRFLFWSLCFCLLFPVGLSSCDGSDSAAVIFGGTTGELTWTLTEDGVLTITGEGPMPDYRDGGTSETPPWYPHVNRISSLTIGEGVTRIGDYAFMLCSFVTEVVIPESVTSMGDWAFWHCQSLIAEKLMMRDGAYYQKNFQQNTSPISRDFYIENKVKSVMESFLSDVTFYSSVHYKIVEDEVEKNPELDILGVSDKAVYIIEVKAHELSYKDRVRLDGAKYKFKASVAEACKQCCRSVDFINNSTEPIFGTQQGAVLINKTKPIYKIAVTFQHYSSLLGQMDKLVAASLMEERFRDTWVVSLFDLMVVADFVESEDEFLSYLDMRKIINTNHSTFHDELDLLGQFLNENLADKVIANKPMMIIGGSSDIDEEYAKDFYLPINLSSEKE